MSRFEAWIRLFRAHHWIKNGFVLAPLLFAGRGLDAPSWAAALVAFAQFCLAASAVYIFNDLRDLESDRKHPTKSLRRPIASGVISPAVAWTVLVLLLLAFAATFSVGADSGLIVSAYIVLNLLYSLWLKHIAIVDIFTIAIGFVLRVYAGAVAIDVPVSGWMFVTVLSLALFLGALKRRQEIVASGASGRAVLKNYSPDLLDRYAEASAIGALVFYCLYVISTSPNLIGTVPIVLFGLFRYWYIVDIRSEGESPTELLYKDPWLLGSVILWTALTALLIYVEKVPDVL